MGCGNRRGRAAVGAGGGHGLDQSGRLCCRRGNLRHHGFDGGRFDRCGNRRGCGGGLHGHGGWGFVARLRLRDHGLDGRRLNRLGLDGLLDCRSSFGLSGLNGFFSRRAAACG